MSAWPVTALREALPEAHITWAVEDSCMDVVDTSRLVQRLEVFPRKAWQKSGSPLRTWRDQIRTYTRLRRHQYDFGIDLHGHTKTALALRLSGAKRRVAVRATDALSAALNPVPLTQGPTTHMVEHQMNVLKVAGFDLQLPARPYMPPRPEVPSLPEGPFISICTGGSSQTKRYPEEHWRSVCQELRASGCRVVAVGGPADPKLGDSCDLDLVGKTSLVETMTVIERSSLHIATDTGTGHFAAALGAPVVSLFGNQENQLRKFRPFSDDVSIVQGDPDCRAIPPDDVTQAALRRLGIL